MRKRAEEKENSFLGGLEAAAFITSHAMGRPLGATVPTAGHTIVQIVRQKGARIRPYHSSNCWAKQQSQQTTSQRRLTEIAPKTGHTIVQIVR
jgi:hypothetical protein